MKRILLIGDIVGCGKLGMSAMIPILSKMKYDVCRLPSSIVSNNFCYGEFAVLDTTDYLCKSIEIWEKLDFYADAVATGYLVSEKQTKIVADYCSLLKQRGTKIFVDPIMADDGKLYNGATEKTVEYMREICCVADIMVPNFTEAKFLANKYLDKNSLSNDEALDLAKILFSLGGATVVITSMVVNNENCTLLFDSETERFELFKYDRIPVQFSGTGDVFLSILLGQYLRGVEVKDSVVNAMNFVSEMIKRNASYANPSNGIPIEMYLNEVE